MMQPAIEISKLSFSYEKEKTILDHISFSINQGESVGLIGANGCGKSTLIKMIAGLLPSSGTIKVSGLEVCDKNIAEIRKNIGMLFQDSDSQLFMPTVYDDLAFGPRNYGMSAKEQEKLVCDVLNKLDLIHLKNRHNYKLSGGEKRMVCMAVTIAMNPDIVLLDEPTIALDPYNRRRLINVLNELKETKLIASHDLDMILETCERVILIDGTRIVADGKAEDILSNKSLLEKSHLELPFCMQGVRVYNKT